MAEMGTIAAAVSVIRAAVKGLRGLKEHELSSEHAKAVDAALELMGESQDRVNAIHDELISLREENHQLRKQIDEHDTWEQRRNQFRLTTAPGGARVYYESKEPNDLYVCPVCIENRQVMYLQDRNVATGEWQCPNCAARFPVGPRTEMAPFATRSKFNPFDV